MRIYVEFLSLPYLSETEGIPYLSFHCKLNSAYGLFLSNIEVPSVIFDQYYVKHRSLLYIILLVKNNTRHSIQYISFDSQNDFSSNDLVTTLASCLEQFDKISEHGNVGHLLFT